MTVQVYHNPETDLFDITVIGAFEYDDICDLTEQEAKDEADAIADETGYTIEWV